MTTSLRQGDTVASTTFVSSGPLEVYELISDVTRFPEWSPECVRCEWSGEKTFRGWNRRRFGRWSTASRVDVADPGREFAFVVQMLGRDFTRWAYRLAEDGAGTRITEEVTMCIDLPYVALLFERLALRVDDRRADLRGNLDHSLRRIKEIVDRETATPLLDGSIVINGTDLAEA